MIDAPTEGTRETDMSEMKRYRVSGVERLRDSDELKNELGGSGIRRRGLRAAGLTFSVAFVAFGIFGAVSRADTPADRFVAGLESESRMPADARALVRKTWSECDDCDGDEFLAQGLAVLSSEFRAGLDAYDAGDYPRCVAKMSTLGDDKNRFVATNAVMYEIKSLVAMEHLLEAGHRIDDVLGGQPVGDGPVAAYSYFAPELVFLKGFCLLADLRYDEASVALATFLGEYPTSSQRLVIAAKQMLAELQNREPERIGEVVDLMNYSGRRLNTGDSGETVRERQKRIIELLDKLIKEAEDNENNSNNSGSSGGSGGQGAQKPGDPMQQSQLPGSRAAEGALRERRRANPGEMWGSMPPGERERILQALRDNFPSRYRRLVEQYYEELAKKP